MLKIREAIVVEGRYDKIALENAVDTVIFTTEGFGIFRDAEKAELLRRVAEKRGLIVLTDSDGAGLVIRNRLRGCIAPEYLKHAYIPELPGKERRKTKASREGTLGVEGMPLSVLEDVLRRAGATETEGESALPLTKTDVFSLGLSGTADAAAVKTAKTVISTALPVVGGILSDASASVLSAAGVIRASAGAFSLVAVCALCIAPFARLGVKLIVFKAASAVAETVPNGRMSALLDDIGTAMGILAGTVGSFAVILFFSFTSAIRAVV